MLTNKPNDKIKLLIYIWNVKNNTVVKEKIPDYCEDYIPKDKKKLKLKTKNYFFKSYYSDTYNMLKISFFIDCITNYFFIWFTS